MSDAPSTTSWLAAADHLSSWAHHPWTDFAGLNQRELVLAIIPLHGFADHGMGLPLDAEEVVGSAVLEQAVSLFAASGRCRVLPPVRFGLAPYPSSFFGVDAETAHDLLREVAESVHQAGFHKVVFFNTSPWNEELVDVAARDARVAFKLQTFVINSSGLGLDFHPAGPARGDVQAAAARILGIRAEASPRQADQRDLDFRPGQFRQPAPVVPGKADGGAVLDQAAERLARLLAEIEARAPLGSSTHGVPREIVPNDTRTLPQIFPQRYRSRYLGGWTREQFEDRPLSDALVILPTGAIEQHGPHLPVGVDSILGQAWLAHALEKLPADAKVFVSPCISFGKSNEHTSFEGTVTVSAKTLRRLVRAIVHQLYHRGVRKIALLNTHGGNSAVLVYTIRELQSLPGLRIGLLGQPYKPDVSAQEAEFGFHAGEWETSLMLAVAPELVRMKEAVREYPARIDDPGELRPENAPAIFSWITADVSRSGVMGDAPAATIEKGKRWLESGAGAIAQRLAKLLAEAPAPL